MEMITKKDLNKYINTKDTIIVIDFYADWCSPCKRVKPHYHKLSMKYDNHIFLSVNIEKLDVKNQFNIRVLPTFLILKNKITMSRVVGSNMTELEETIKLI